MALGGAITVATLAAAWSVGDYRDLADRLMVAATAGAIVAAWLAAAIARVAFLRFTSPTGIDGAAVESEEPPDLRMARAILSNTLEQMALALPACLAVAVLIDSGGAVIAALAGLFSAGRLLFWSGYAEGGPARALGFALTSYPSVVALAGVLATVLLRAIS